MDILITGAAGFIGYSLARSLLERGDSVIGIDNHNDYYDQTLKDDRAKLLMRYENYRHFRVDISDKALLFKAFDALKPICVVNLAAQAGVRYSLQNPAAYLESNIIGFGNVLEACRYYDVGKLVYASSSSVYGANATLPFSIKDSVDKPLNIYAATKKANELMAHAYNHLYGVATVGLRFFTVYGPWGRPDMALFKFADAITKGKPIELFNYGNHKRDFTYIDDIVAGLLSVIDKTSQRTGDSVYNIGGANPVPLIDYVEALESALGKEAKKILLPLQPGDMLDTYADMSEFSAEFDFSPKVRIAQGVSNFADWYKDYYK